MDGLTFKNTQIPTGGTGISDAQSQSLEISGTQRRALHNEISSAPSLSTSAVPGASFADTLGQAVQQVNQLQKDADKAITNLATGKTDNIADVMVQTEQADIALKLMMQVRNKIIDAYQEVMKMQV